MKMCLGPGGSREYTSHCLATLFSSSELCLQVGVGGGSSMDVAKVAAFLCGDTKQVDDENHVENSK